MGRSPKRSPSGGLVVALERACEVLWSAATETDKDLVEAVTKMLQAAKSGTPPAPAAVEVSAPPPEDLRLALERTQQQVRRQQEFLAIVAHELRNPITPIAFSLDLLLAQAEHGRLPDEATLVRRLEMVKRQVARLHNDLERLLDFSRIRSGRLELHLEPLDLAKVVHETLEEMKPQLEASRCELRSSISPDLHGHWDRMRVRQIVWNLVSNAAKFGAGAPVEVVVEPRREGVELRVRDHGPGIGEEERERVFDRFERVSPDRHHSGFGVGLWLVRRIVHAHGGSISFESVVGAGTTFVITLPWSTHERH